jgi:hypothetical protein
VASEEKERGVEIRIRVKSEHIGSGVPKGFVVLHANVETYFIKALGNIILGPAQIQRLRDAATPDVGSQDMDVGPEVLGEGIHRVRMKNAECGM